MVTCGDPHTNPWYFPSELEVFPILYGLQAMSRVGWKRSKTVKMDKKK